LQPLETSTQLRTIANGINRSLRYQKAQPKPKTQRSTPKSTRSKFIGYQNTSTPLFTSILKSLRAKQTSHPLTFSPFSKTSTSPKTKS
jgi:hypothetical protein